MGTVIINALLKYLESHPDVIEKLVAEAIDALLKQLQAHNAK